MRGFPILVVCLGLLAVPAAIARQASDRSSGRPFTALESEVDELRAEVNQLPFDALEARIEELRAEIEKLRSQAAETVKPPLIVDSADRVLGPMVRATPAPASGTATAPMLLFRGNGKSTLLLARGDSVLSSRELYFVGPNCLGQAYGDAFIPGAALGLAQAGFFYPATGRVLGPDPNVPHGVLRMCSQTFGLGSNCFTSSGVFCFDRAVVPMEEIGILEYTPPLRIE